MRWSERFFYITAWAAIVVGALALTFGCASAPVQKPVVVIYRQMILVPYVAPVEECCWYEPPADTDYGPV